METYRGHNISYDPPPIPIRSMDWHWVHPEFDGAEDSTDRRYGHCASLEACKAEIDEYLDGEPAVTDGFSPFGRSLVEAWFGDEDDTP